MPKDFSFAARFSLGVRSNSAALMPLSSLAARFRTQKKIDGSGGFFVLLNADTKSLKHSDVQYGVMLMAKRCAVTGKKVMSGNNVSHAKNKTKRRFLPNLQNVSFVSETLGKVVRLRLSTQGIRTLEHKGGLDAFLQETPTEKLDKKLRSLKSQIAKTSS